MPSLNPFGDVAKALDDKKKPTTTTTAKKAKATKAAGPPNAKQIAANTKKEVKTIKAGIKAERKPSVSAKDLPKNLATIQKGREAGKRLRDPGASRGSGSKTKHTRGL